MEKVMVGKIVNTCGLKGEVKVINSSDFAKERYKKGNKLFVSNEKDINKELTISSSRDNNKFYYLKFNEINSIEEAEKYKECTLYVDGETLKKINNDTYYHYELINMEVYYKSNVIGKITEITDNGVQTLIRVETNDSSVLVPFINDFLEKVDTKEKKIYLKDLEGLI